jgi:hypothetical protein
LKRNIELADQPNEPGKFTALRSSQQISKPSRMNLHRSIFSYRRQRAISGAVQLASHSLLPIQ